MRIFITGATGFVGSHVMDQILSRGHDILAFTLKKDANENWGGRIQWLYGDMEDLEELKPAIKTFDPQIVIHLAWQGIPDYSEIISRSNLNNSIQLFDYILEETGCKKVIVAGSCLEYGKDKGVCNESDSVEPKYFFAWAKCSLWQYLSLKCSQRNVALIWFRIFYVYGPRQRPKSLIPTIVESLKHGKVPNMRFPLNRNDFIYVEDVAKAFGLAAEKDIEAGIYNLGCGFSKSVYDVCKVVENYLLKCSVISDSILVDGPKEERLNFFSDMSKTNKFFGWHPQTPLEIGIAKYIESLK